MSLMPSRVKYRKNHRGKMRGNAMAGYELNYGDYGLKTLDRGWFTAAQIEAARVSIARHVKRGGKLWLRVFPDKSFCKKPAETRMGKGKGAPEYYVAVVKPGRILFEMGGVPEELARSAMRICAHKIPFRTKFVKREKV